MKVTNKYKVAAHISSAYLAGKTAKTAELRLTGLVVSPKLAASLRKGERAVMEELTRMAEKSWLDPKIEVELVADSEDLEDALQGISRAVWCTAGNCMCSVRRVRWSSLALK